MRFLVSSPLSKSRVVRLPSGSRDAENLLVRKQERLRSLYLNPKLPEEWSVSKGCRVGHNLHGGISLAGGIENGGNHHDRGIEIPFQELVNRSGQSIECMLIKAVLRT